MYTIISEFCLNSQTTVRPVAVVTGPGNGTHFNRHEGAYDPQLYHDAIELGSVLAPTRGGATERLHAVSGIHLGCLSWDELNRLKH